MQLIRWILLLIAMLIGVWFAYLNMDEKIVVSFWKYRTKPLPVFIVIYISFILGLCRMVFKISIRKH